MLSGFVWTRRSDLTGLSRRDSHSLSWQKKMKIPGVRSGGSSDNLSGLGRPSSQINIKKRIDVDLSRHAMYSLFGQSRRLLKKVTGLAKKSLKISIIGLRISRS